MTEDYPAIYDERFSDSLRESVTLAEDEVGMNRNISICLDYS